MWLVDKDSDGIGPRRILLPLVLRTALIGWYTGQGSHEDEEAGIALVQQARIGGRWIACDCLANGRLPPIMTPAFLSEAETYYLRRLTSGNRPEHDPTCPFFRDQITHRLTEDRNLDGPAEPPSGYFAVLKPAPQKLAQRPDDDASDDRTRQSSTPRLARLLWRLLENASLNRCLPMCASADERSITDEFRRLRVSANRLEVAPGIELGRVFWTHAAALHSRQIYAALRTLADRWPSGHAPQGFLTLFAQSFRGHEIHMSHSAPVRIANRIQSPSSQSNPNGGPYLVIVVVGEYPEAHGYAPLRAYAQPIYSGHHFIPVATALERRLLKELLSLQRTFDRDGIELAIEKPIFSRLTPTGICRADFVAEARSSVTGEVKTIAIQALDHRDPVYLASRRASIAPFLGVMPIVEITSDVLNKDQLYQALTRAFGI